VIVDPTDGDGVLGEWQFDPAAPEHAGWRDQYAAFDQTNRPGLLQFTERMGMSETQQSPEAVVQVALTKAALRWPEVAAMDNPRAWVYTVAANLVRKAYANSKKMREERAVQPGWTSAAARGPAVAVEAVHRVDVEARDRVEDDVLDRLEPGAAIAALADLRLEQRMAVHLFDVEGFSGREVAEVLGCTPEKVTSLLRGGRSTLRRWLTDRKQGASFGWAGPLLGVVVAVRFERQIQEALRALHLPVHEIDPVQLGLLLSLLPTALAQLTKVVADRIAARLARRPIRIRRWRGMAAAHRSARWLRR
jgi:RNA polymerase sigma factor (sigma-70 family)